MPEEIKGIVILQPHFLVSMDTTARLQEQLDKFCNSVGMKGLIVGEGMEASVNYDLKPLVVELHETSQALKSYTVATFELLQVVAQFMQFIASEKGDDPDSEPETYLDGKKI